jgi:predicted transcriptional regulator
MGRRVTLELSDEVLERAERLAVLAQRDVTQVLSEAISAFLPPVDAVSEETTPASELSDKQVLRLA